MPVETHWICDVCGNRVVKSSQTKDVNESGIKNWYVVNMRIGKVENPHQTHSAYRFGYACSEKCLGKVIDALKELAKKEMLNHEVEK